MVQAMYEIRVAGAVPEQDLKDMGAVTVGPEHLGAGGDDLGCAPMVDR